MKVHELVRLLQKYEDNGDVEYEVEIDGSSLIIYRRSTVDEIEVKDQ